MAQTNAKAHFFDEHAQGWEERNYPPEVRARLVSLVASFPLKDGDTVLDVGCGEGVLVPYLREHVGESGRLIELDPSEVMLRGAAKKDHGRPWLLKAAVETIPLLSESIDTVIAFACFPHFEDAKHAVQEMFRVTKAGGYVVVAHLLSREELRQHHAQHFQVEHDVLPDDLTMRTLFEAAGWRDVTIEEAPGLYRLVARKP